MDKQKFELLEEKVRQWFVDKGLADGDPKKQWLKLQSEFGELCDAILKNDKDEFIDAVGDVMVVLTGLTMQTGSDYRLASICEDRLLRRTDNVYSYVDKINSHQGDIISWLLLNVGSPILIYNSLNFTMLNLHFIAECKGVSVLDCYETAYNVISKRKGKTVNGVFIKEEQ